MMEFEKVGIPRLGAAPTLPLPSQCGPRGLDIRAKAEADTLQATLADIFPIVASTLIDEALPIIRSLAGGSEDQMVVGAEIRVREVPGVILAVRVTGLEVVGPTAETKTGKMMNAGQTYNRDDTVDDFVLPGATPFNGVARRVALPYVLCVTSAAD